MVRRMRFENMKVKYILVSLVLLAVVFAGANCLPSGTASSPPSTAPPVSTSSTPTPPPAGIQNPSPLADFVSVISQVRPSVVAINTESTGYSIFTGAFTEEGAGSGWIIDTNGLIVTNNHVVEDANSITVTLQDGRTFPAESVYTDPVADLAVVKIKAQNLPALRIGDSSKLQVGEWVIAIGNSLGLGISATKGIVSALDVALSTSPGETLHGLVQTDAAINPGNSGGPLVNMLGEVVGINSVKVAQVGVEGMGYAISIKQAKPIIDQLINNGYVTRPYLGVEVYTVDQFAVLRYRLAVDKGALVIQVVPGGPASKAGLKQGDVITAIGGKDVTSAGDITPILESYGVGQQVEVIFYRGNTRSTVTATLVQALPQ